MSELKWHLAGVPRDSESWLVSGGKNISHLPLEACAFSEGDEAYD